VFTYLEDAVDIRDGSVRTAEFIALDILSCPHGTQRLEDGEAVAK
jgi:hypothetical protein